MFLPQKIAGANHRVWRRIQTLKDLHEVGRALNLCVRDTYSDYGGLWDSEFLQGEVEFWILDSTDGAPLVLLRFGLDGGVRHEIEAAVIDDNPVPPVYAKDVEALLRVCRVRAPSHSGSPKGLRTLAHLGLFGDISLHTDEPDYRVGNEDEIAVWDRMKERSSLYLHQPGRGFAVVRLQSVGKADDNGTPLPGLDEIADRGPGSMNRAEPDLGWVARGLQGIMERAPHGAMAKLLRRLPDFVGGEWWAKADREHRIPAGKTYWRTERGVTSISPSSAADQSPEWVIAVGNRGRLYGQAADLFSEHPELARELQFWRWVDPEAKGVGFLAPIREDRSGKPHLGCAPVCDDDGKNPRWVGWKQGWRADPGLQPPSGAQIRLRYRPVLDWDTLEWKAGSGQHLGTAKRPYGWQVVAFQSGSALALAAGLLRRSTPKQERYVLLLDAPGRDPSATAALIAGVKAWCEGKTVDIAWKDPGLAAIGSHDATGRSLVAFRANDRRLVDPPSGLEGAGWRETKGHVFGYTAGSLLLWLAPTSGERNALELGDPVPAPGVGPLWKAHALEVALQGQYRLSEAWSALVGAQGGVLPDNGIPHRPAIPGMARLVAGMANATLVAAPPGHFRWRIEAPVLEPHTPAGDPYYDEDDGVVEEVAYLEVDEVGRCALTLIRDDLAAASELDDATLAGRGYPRLSNDATDGVRRIIAAVASALGARPDARMIGWVALRAGADGRLITDDRSCPSLALHDVEVAGVEGHAVWFREGLDYFLEGDDGKMGYFDVDGLRLPYTDVDSIFAAAAVGTILAARAATVTGDVRIVKDPQALSTWGVGGQGTVAEGLGIDDDDGDLEE